MASKLRYFLLIPLALFASTGVFTGSAAAAPSNDNFASAQTLTGTPPITVAANNIGATAEAGEPDSDSIPPFSSVWFRWIPTAPANMVLDLCHASFSGDENATPVMAVRSGNNLATLVPVAAINGPCSLRFHANAGVTYNFQVDYYDREGTFNLTLREQIPPSNDNFATPTTLGPALPITANSTTVDSTWEAGEPPGLGGTSNSRSVWFSWTAPESQRVRLSLCEKSYVDGPLNDSTIIYTGATLATLVKVAETTSSDCEADFPVIAGTTYRIAVSGSSRGEFGFLLKLKAAPPPANDNFADARILGPGLPVNTTGDNDFATEETGEPDDHGGYSGGTSRSVWFSWTAGISGHIRLKTCNPKLTLFTSVYTGTLITALTEVSQRFSYAPCSRFFDAVAGTTYRFAVAGAPFDRTHGAFVLNLHQVTIPINDSFSAAIRLGSGLPVTRKSTTVDATTEPNEPSHTSTYGSNGGSVWFRWKAPNDNPAIFSACSKGEANRITVYERNPESEGSGLLALRQLDNDDHSCRGGSKGGRLAIAPDKGASYAIVVTPAVEDYESAFTLKVEGIANPKAGFNLKKAIAKCRKLKGKKKQTRCIRAAKKKAALTKCQKIADKKKKAKCVKSARRRFK